MSEAVSPEEHARHIIDYYLEPKNEWARTRIERVMEAVQPADGERVLDLGCANATFSFHAAGAGAHPIGLDRDAAALREGRRIAVEFAGLATPRVQSDAALLPFASEVFDVVINADFMEHVPEDRKPLIYREMYRVMKKGGRGVVYTPNRTRVEWELRGERIKKKVGLRIEDVPTWTDYVDADHYGMTDPYETVTLLRQAGFSTRTSYFEFHVPLLSKIPGVNFLLEPVLSPFLSNRILVRVEK